MKRHDAVVRLSKLPGLTLRDADGNAKGVVQAVVVDIDSGMVRYFALQWAGEQGTKMFAVPWDRLSLRKNDKGEFILAVDIPPEEFSEAKGFTEDKWPDLADKKWRRDLDVYYTQDVRPLGSLASGQGVASVKQAETDSVAQTPPERRTPVVRRDTRNNVYPYPYGYGYGAYPFFIDGANSGLIPQPNTGGVAPGFGTGANGNGSIQAPVPGVIPSRPAPAPQPGAIPN